MNIVLCYQVEPKHVAAIEAAAPGCQVINAGQEGIAEAILDADIFIGHAKVPVPWEEVVARGRLKFIQSSAAGLDHCLVPSVIHSGIVVCSASGLFANQVAEQTLALLLGLLRGLPVFFRQTLSKEYVRRPTDDLHGKRIGIIGLGGNGRRLVQVLQPFAVEVDAIDYYPVKKPAGVRELLPPEDLLEVVSRSEILILTIPLNEATYHWIGRNVFEAMPRGSYLINVARGQVVVENDLIDALKSGHLRGAGLDVAEVEPLPNSSLLWDLPNVIITPHVGAQAARRIDDATLLACINLQRFIEGQSLFNQVDKRLGFPHPDVLYNAGT